MKISRSYRVKAIVVFVSIFFMGLGIALMRFSAMGTDPCNSFNFGIAEHFDIPLGVPAAILNLILLIFSILFYRDSIGLGTIVNMFGCGFAADFWRIFFRTTISEESFAILDDSIGLRFILVLIGISILGFFASFYMAANMGLAPYDAMAFIIEKLAKIKFRNARIIVDSTALILAVIVTMPDGRTLQVIGIGTVILALGLGPILAFIMENLARPLIQRWSRG